MAHDCTLTNATSATTAARIQDRFSGSRSNYSVQCKCSFRVVAAESRSNVLLSNSPSISLVSKYIGGCGVPK